jgi:SAM-dependent methyltransferase
MKSDTFLFRPIERCLLCEKDHMVNVVPLEPIPIATPNFAMPSDPALAQQALKGVPLDIFQCADCGHLQVGQIGNPDLQYRDYVYTTSLSLGLPEHFKTYAAQVIDKYSPPAGSLVVEVGSNDGTLLRAFKERGHRVLGVDPARAIAAAATEAGIETIGDFFSERIAGEIARDTGKAQLIIANNMIANVPDLQDYLRGVDQLLADDGIFIFETQYGADVIEHNLLDTVYHEHISYFLIKPTVEFLARHGLQTIGVDRIPTKGGSIRVSSQRTGKSRSVSPDVAQIIREETTKSVFAPPYFTKVTRDLAEIKRAINERIDAVLASGKTAGGYGVSVGTTALLPQFGLMDRLSFMVDDDPKKARTLEGPGYSIPVIGPAELYSQNAGTVVVFAWRYADSIIAKHERFLAEGGEFIIPLPAVRIVRK